MCDSTQQCDRFHRTRREIRERKREKEKIDANISIMRSDTTSIRLLLSSYCSFNIGKEWVPRENHWRPSSGEWMEEERMTATMACEIVAL